MNLKVASLEEELRLWKDTAIAREKQLVDARLQRDLFAAQLTSKPSGEGDMKAQRELEQMRLRFECADAARKALNEKYNSVLEGYDETLAGSPLRSLNLNTSRKTDIACKTPAQLKKERRMTMFTPPRNQTCRKSRAFKPVLFDDNEEGDAMEGRCRLQQHIDEIRAEKFDLEDRLQELQNELEQLSVKLGRMNELESSKADLEARLSEEHIEHNSLKMALKQVEEIRLRIEQDLVQELNQMKERLAEDQKNAENMVKQERYAHEKTKEFLQLKTDEANQTSASLHRTLEDFREVVKQKDEMQRSLEQLQERNSKMKREFSEEIDKLKKRHADELQTAEIMVEREREAHEKTLELEVLRSAKAEGDRAITELAGHHNQKQKINYLEKVRSENYNLKNRIGELEAELKRYEAAYGKLKHLAKEPIRGPSTRSRSARGFHD
ncbi:hypothetical protein TELCIR_13501 [Teladorsagia circumcincta]|uniref:Uncharacterized protein n=1 Tax=Teladorsagia circumcincta TaxID=45464 RepID=A0A2G9U3U1_TELCI|nr:hypothetical protein TELCIR_13501 [Teladorsagia circumcincta]